MGDAWARLQAQYRQANGLASAASADGQPLAEAPPQHRCAACKTPVQLEVDAFEMASPEQLDVVVTLCARCVFGKMYTLMPSKSIARHLAKVYMN